MDTKKYNKFPNKKFKTNMSGRFGPKVTSRKEELLSSRDSASIGLHFLQVEENFQANKPNEDWKVQGRWKNHPSKSKHEESYSLDNRSRSTVRDGNSGRGSKRSNSRHEPLSTKRLPSHSDTKEGDRRSHSHLVDKTENENIEIPNNQDKVPGTKSNKYPLYKDSKITFTRLQRISAKDSTDIIRTLANSKSGLDDFVSGNIKPDHMYLIVKILSKLTSSDWEANKAHVLLKVSTPEFFKKITEFVTFLVTDEQNSSRLEEMEQFFENLLNFFQAVIVILPSIAAEHLQVPMRTTSMALANVTEWQHITIKDSVKDKMKLLLSDLEERKKEKEEREEISVEKKVQLVYPKPLGSICNIPLYPSPADLESSQQGSIVSNKVKGPYDNVEHYLDVHFRLLREDFIAPLRKGIIEYRGGHSHNKGGKTKVSSIRIYKRVTFLKPRVLADKVCYDICIDQERRLRVKWENTKRFIYGSLLILTTDNFKTFFLATVVQRDLEKLEKLRVVSVVLCDTTGVSKNLLTTEFLMAESEVYFEPYYNVLKALQKFKFNTFPLVKYIVYVEKRTDRPQYTRNGSDVYTISVGDKGINGRRTFKLFEDNTWPSCSELGFDESQRQSFKAALTNDLVVIQGPPGTGKTYIGLKIAAALLENSVVWNFDRKTPILVICYTNHALDQFLEGILENGLTNNLIRVGGRSKSKALEAYNLKERRRSAAFFSPNYDQAALLKDLKKEMADVFEGIKTVQDNLDSFDKAVGILSLKTLLIVMNENQTNFFKDNDDLVSWLLLGVQLRSRKQLISYGDRSVETETNENIKEFVYDESDIENVTRLKEVLFDSMDFEVTGEPSNFSEQIKVYYSFTLEEIKKKIEEFNRELQIIPTQESVKREVLQSQMRDVKKGQSDLVLIYEHFQRLLSYSNIPTQEEINRVYQCDDVSRLNLSDRWLLYKVWIEFLKSGNWSLLESLEERYRKGGERFEETRQYDDLKVVQQADVVGVTTTTAARLQAMLRELKPKIVIVEEAAEVLEAHIVASLSVHCQHLILIGDHKQLKPSPADYRVGKDHHLDVSLFERLIDNGIKHYTLTTQHRMRPEISTLLVPTIYPVLHNHVSTLSRPRILGMENSIFFLNHNHFEAEVVDIVSKRNEFEARMAMGLARHLLLQGYRPDEITVLATYSGQMYLLKEEQRRLEVSKDLLVTVVDNFQGEENRIIILSLVRSNTDKKIGFLKTDNRVCVALSRARDGLFIFGNMDCLTAESKLWQEIRNSLIKQKSFGTALLLRCETHRNKLTSIQSEKDFDQVKEGGCRELCGEQLPCGHTCLSLCHVSKDRHIRYRCSQPCNRMICNDSHSCSKKCYEPCGKCHVPMLRTLDCGHQSTLPCCVDYRKLQCQILVNIKFNECGHEVEVECYRRQAKQCPEPCVWRLECGHQCTRTCHAEDDPDHLMYKCPKPCSRVPVNCTTEGHQCPLACFEECEECSAMVVKHLVCGHSLTVPCKETDLICTLPCKLQLPCGHPCRNLCNENCGNCRVKVEKTIPLCGHRVKMACSISPTKELCNGKCCVVLPCGHKCAKRCKDTCSINDCEEPTPVTVALPCGHSGALLPCNLVKNLTTVGLADMDRELLVQYCSEPCLEVLACSHRCSGTCGKCLQGRIHTVCEEDCNNTLICGHSCPVPCRQVCPPCQKPCPVRCIHTNCNKKCGEPCISCTEPCEYRCFHTKCSKRCGELCNRKPCTQPCLLPLECTHPCVGFCGEPCPPCKECYPDHYEPVFYTGEEDDPDTKWVLLNDCKHVVDAPNLERWLEVGQEGSEIKLKRCPKCTPTAPDRHIATTQRYMNLVKTTFADIQLVKKKMFGEVEKIREKRKELLEEVRNIPVTRLDGITDTDVLLKLRGDLEKSLPIVKNNRRKEIGIEKLHVLEFMVAYLTEMENHRKNIWMRLNGKTRFKLTGKINTLTQVLRQREHKISQAEIESFSLEQTRIVRLSDLLILESSAEYSLLDTQPQVVACFKKAEGLVSQLTRYTSAHDTKVLGAIQELKKAIRSNAQLSDAERKMIHQAMSKSFFGGLGAQGHWFKCPNGHPYVITECGGAMQVAVCPEKGCGAQIGGTNHRYLPNQQLASEMDGARRPAWSSGNDMANFNLDNIR